jgi:uncharacterized protein (TIGR02246 family)
MNGRSMGLAALAVLGSLGLAATGVRAMSHNEAMRAAIEASARQFEAAFSAGDAAAVAALYSEEGKVLPPDGEVVSGRAAIQAFWQGAIAAAPGTGLALHVEEVLGDGDVVAEVGHYTMTDPAGATIEQGKYTTLWRHEGDTWRIYRDIWNLTPLAPMAAE